MNAGFLVRGEVDGTPYTVEVTGRRGEPVVGSKRIRELVAEGIGETIAVTPTGPTVTVDPADGASILALLGVRTTVTELGHGAPDIKPPRRLGGAS